MEQRQLDYTDPCSECSQLENCGPSMCQKINLLENELHEIKLLLLQMAEKAKYYYGI
jgi:hypothetical protein